MRLEHIDAIHLYADRSVGLWQQRDVRLAEDDEEIALAGVLEVFGHVQVCVHARLEHWQLAKLGKFSAVGFEVEGAGNQYVEPGISRFTRRCHQVGALHGTEFRADEDGGAFF
ncbi:hypothetical protein D9M69_586580 [compost metagenome]